VSAGVARRIAPANFAEDGTDGLVETEWVAVKLSNRGLERQQIPCALM
jgi:hypothetical protein